MQLYEDLKICFGRPRKDHLDLKADVFQSVTGWRSYMTPLTRLPVFSHSLQTAADFKAFFYEIDSYFLPAFQA